METPYINPRYGACADKNPWQGGVEEKDYIPLVDACGKDVKVWTIAPERPDLVPFLEYARKVNPDVVFSVGHSEATPMQIRALGKYRPTLMTHTFDATGRQPVFDGTRGYGPDEYCMQTPEMYAELISDSMGIHVHPEMQRLLLQRAAAGVKQRRKINKNRCRRSNLRHRSILLYNLTRPSLRGSRRTSP